MFDINKLKEYTKTLNEKCKEILKFTDSYRLIKEIIHMKKFKDKIKSIVNEINTASEELMNFFDISNKQY